MSAKVLVYNKNTGFAWVREFDTEHPPMRDQAATDVHELNQSITFSTLVGAVRCARAEGHDVKWWSSHDFWAPLSTEAIR